MNEETIYFAGGCFWGLEKYFSLVPGVTQVTSGYAQGNVDCVPSYEAVCSGTTGYKEAVKVDFDSTKVSLEALIFAFFHVIDPTVHKRQGNDRGEQYQTGIYYVGAEQENTVNLLTALEKSRWPVFAVEHEELRNFYPAEEYHQKYLDKNPSGYCHIPFSKFEDAKNMHINPARYTRPFEQEIAEKLTPEQYQVTQHDATEPPFKNEFWENEEPGLYVDVVTGEPLFSSADKYVSSCGWPAFAKPIDQQVIVDKEDLSHGRMRTEVRSRTGNSHLGHVFEGDTESPTSTRYCINSASLEFIPLDQMDARGYGDLKPPPRPKR